MVLCQWSVEANVFFLSLELITKGKLATEKDLSADALGFSHLSFSKQQHSNHCWGNLP